MAHRCNQKCRINYKTNGCGGFPYERGYKFCKTCDIYILYEGIWCPCCGYRLRIKNRYAKLNKWKYEEMYFLKAIQWAGEIKINNKILTVEAK